jgi:hypothetical protein
MEFGAGTDVKTTRVYGEDVFTERRIKNVMFVRVNPKDFHAPLSLKYMPSEK